MPIQSSQLIEVKQVPGKGRGVFATAAIPEGTEVERVPVLVMPAQDVLNGTTGALIQQYVFEWGRDTVALALGFGSMYNHSFSPNARYDDVGRQTKVYTAVRDIQPGEEITINYNGHEDDQTPVGFDVKELPVRSQSPVQRSQKTQEDAVKDRKPATSKSRSSRS